MWSDPTLLKRPLRLPRGPLASATGQRPSFDPAVLTVALSAMREVLPSAVRGGPVPFGPVVEVPFVPLDIFRLRTANVVAVLLLGTVVSLFFFATLWTRQVMEYSPQRAGLACLPLAVATAVAAGVASALVTRWGPQRVPLAVAFVIAWLGWSGARRERAAA
ncbi:hypothetical protein [Streptomyces profundus]|uniref:hypothetical protein n=1 Tax=Streptomyces profundus TaxID=2867410 RepID=UPI001D16C24A|nr:hypothetical protein [Streptomyces sp. MA3_2.13]UED82778.1 hypothetical protein K4G22_00100 [Streptomyces sp. MA3_2.13]